MTDRTDLLLTIKSQELSRGLRPSKRMPRNSKFLVECAGCVGRDGVLQALDELTAMISNTYTHPYDNQTGGFTVGNPLYGADGAVATIIRDSGSELDLLFTFGSLSDDEIIYESALGSELITNGDFANWTGDDPDWWEQPSENGTNYLTEVSGQCRLVADNVMSVFKYEVVENGKFYRHSIDIKTVVSGALRSSDLATGNLWSGLDSTGISTFIVQARSNHFSIAEDNKPTDITFDDVSVKQITNAALANGVVTNTFTFPYPQIFVFTNVIIVCSATHIYEWVSGALVHKLTVAAGSTWTAIDFFDYIYLSNGTVAVERSSMDKTYSTTTSLPTAMAACNFNGQVILGAPDAGYEA